jgi:von Willebrand factor type A domain-containing protein
MRRAWIPSIVVLGAVLLAGCAREAGQSPPATSTPDASSRGPAPETAMTYAADRKSDSDRPEKADVAETTITPERPSLTKKPERRIQSGTLSAGSFDDIERFADYRRFLSKAMQADAGGVLPELRLGQRVMIHVSDEQGLPVCNARVVVRESRRHAQQKSKRDRQPAAPFDLPTGTDGRTMFLTGMDSGTGADEFSVTVRPPDGSEPVVVTMRADESPWRITLPGTVAKAPTRLDLALVVDTTGSMSDELEYLKVEIDSIAQTVFEMFPNVDQRYSLIVYRDDGDEYVTRVFDFTDSLEGFRTTLAAQSASGGGDYPEAVHRALEHAGELDWRGGDTARVLFLVGDAPPHDAFAGQTIDAVETLRAEGVRIFPVASSGVKFKAEFVMRAASFMTLGQYLFLTDHSGVGNPHAEPHVPDYRVELLNRLMIRMITSELCGRRLGPEEIIAFEQGKLQPEFGQLQTRCRYRSTSPPLDFSYWRQAAAYVPRWMMLVALVAGICIFDSLSGRSS